MVYSSGVCNRISKAAIPDETFLCNVCGTLFVSPRSFWVSTLARDSVASWSWSKKASEVVVREYIGRDVLRRTYL